MLRPIRNNHVTLTASGLIYGGWMGASVTRGIDRFSADFDLEVSERWPGQTEAWPLPPFTPCAISIGSDQVLNGYVDVYAPEVNATSHNVRVSGRSRTCDLVDCMPEIAGGQFDGYPLDSLARAVAGPFGIGVIVETDQIGGSFPDATLGKTTTAHEFLAEKARLRGLLMYDDPNGNLVIASPGTSLVGDTLEEGVNVLSLGARLSGNERFSKYSVLAQAPLSYNGEAAMTNVLAYATDPSVPRYRPYAEMAESALDTAGAALRASWRGVHQIGKALEVHATVNGFRMANGNLWPINELVSVKSSTLKLDKIMLIVSTSFRVDNSGGSRTELTLAPPEAYTPDPAAVQANRSIATAAQWNAALGVRQAPPVAPGAAK